MSNTISISTSTDEFVALDISAKYKELVKTALDSEGIYIRTKETLEEIFQNKAMTAKEQSELLVTVLSNLNNTIINSAMGTALAWATKDKELTLTKIELEYKLGLINKQTDQVTQSIKTEFATTAARNAELLKNYGVLVNSEGVVTDSSIDGKIDKEILLLEQEKVNKVAEAAVLGSKLKESQVAIHKIVADTYENYGNYSFSTPTDVGISTVTKLSGGHISLSDVQKSISQEQAKGYAYNAWSNGAQAASSMIGALLSSENETALTATDVDLWRSMVQKLSAIVAPN